MVYGTWISNVEDIKQETHNFFAAKFRETYRCCPLLINSSIKQFSIGDRNFWRAYLISKK